MHGIRILVVDDYQGAAEIVAEYLDGSGYDARCVTSGAAALEAMASFKPDIVILDIVMPGMDGLEVARRIRSMPDGRTVRIVAMTGFPSDEGRRRACEAGADFYVAKPVSGDQIIEIVVRGRSAA